MTNPILDRVAKAIEEAPTYGFDNIDGGRGGYRVFGIADPGYPTVSTFATYGEAEIEASRLTSQSRARAAIEAMRDGLTDELESIGDAAAEDSAFPTRRAWDSIFAAILK